MDEDPVREPEELPDLTGVKFSEVVGNPRLVQACERVHRELAGEETYEVYGAFGNTP